MIQTLSNLSYLKIDDKIQLFDVNNYKLTNNYQIVNNVFSNEIYLAMVGMNSISSFFDNYFFYSKWDALDEGVNISDVFTDKIKSISIFLNALWIIKDNCINYHWIHIFNTETSIPVQSQIFNTMFSLSDGTFREILYSKEEIEQAIFLSKDIKSILEIDELDLNFSNEFKNIHPGNVNNINLKNMNRLQRAWMFLRSARTENFLPIKISFYMSLLEALFLSQGTEISHKLGERTALFLGGDTESKIKNYDIIKSAYDIRSKFMHGDILKKTNESLINISTNVDSLIRKILIKAINEESNLFKLNQEDFEGYFKKILFN